MAELPLFVFLILLPIACGISIVALVLWARLSADPDQAVHSLVSRAGGQTIFLFDGEDLVDCTPPARRIMEDLAKGGSDLQRLLRGLNRRFGGLPEAARIAETRFEGVYLPFERSDTLRLRFQSWDGFLQVMLSEAEEAGEGFGDRLIETNDPQSELSTLRALSDEAPFLMWQTDADGTVEWGNEAYLEAVAGEDQRSEAAAPEWPPRALFAHAKPRETDPKQPIRLIANDGNQTTKGLSFDIRTVKREGKFLHYGVSAEASVKAETAQREFVQTLTKTFAHLAIGMVIFDRDRKLVLFNPALLDLMSLPVEFLSASPSLYSFLDRLREERLIAEPRNYKAWRKHILDLEAKAADGSYCETWALPGGTTFRVTGRPHPDGAIAFLFEDISAEISLTRRFNAEIELGHAALDAMDEAVAIVSPTGLVSLTNKAYATLWDCVPDEGLIAKRLRQVIEQWREASIDEDGHWDALLEALESRSVKGTWQSDVRLADGRVLTCRTQRLAGGAALIGFRTSAPLFSVVADLAARRKAARDTDHALDRKVAS
ncbi:MAG: PAS-domain containing protein [Pseudomonadota bacterium]